QRSAHAVTLSPYLLRLVDFLLLIQPCNESSSIFLDAARCVQRSHQALQLLHVVLVLETEFGDVDSRRLRCAIVRVRHQHRVSFGSDSLADVSHCRAETKRVNPYYDAWMRARCRVNGRR